MPWPESSVTEERLRFVVAAHRRERSMTELCREFGISRQTGYVWLQRYREGGSKQVVDRSRRPWHSPTRTAAEVEQAIVALRQSWPDWGAPKLWRRLREKKAEWGRISVRTVHRILERNGLIEDEDRHHPATKRFERGTPNELWQMDFKGPQGFNQGSGVGPLSILDDHSRFLLALQHLGSTRMEGVRDTLQTTFKTVGLPDSLLMDHGTPWWNSASPWGISELTIWIMQQGVRLLFSGIRHPQTQGKVERMHGALQRAVRKRRADPDDQQWLDTFRYEYNHIRPHEALDLTTPASHWQPSPRAFQPTVPEWKYEPGMQVVRLAGQGQLGWGGRRWEISRALRHQLVGIEVIDQRAIVYFCRTPMRELDLTTGTAHPIEADIRRALQG